MAKQLRFNLNSVEAKEFLIHKICLHMRMLYLFSNLANFPGSLGKGSEYLKRPTWENARATTVPKPTSLTIHSVFGGLTVPSSCSFPFTQLEFMDYQQLHFPINFDDGLLKVYSPPFISPDTSESNHTTNWGSSPSYEFTADPSDTFPDFLFKDSLF
ncbi:hypothetical protein Tco_1087074 [Tanacetum coccineum]